MEKKTEEWIDLLNEDMRELRFPEKIERGWRLFNGNKFYAKPSTSLPVLITCCSTRTFRAWVGFTLNLGDAWRQTTKTGSWDNIAITDPRVNNTDNNTNKANKDSNVDEENNAVKKDKEDEDDT